MRAGRLVAGLTQEENGRRGRRQWDDRRRQQCVVASQLTADVAGLVRAIVVVVVVVVVVQTRSEQDRDGNGTHDPASGPAQNSMPPRRNHLRIVRENAARSKHEPAGENASRTAPMPAPVSGSAVRVLVTGQRLEAELFRKLSSGVLRFGVEPNRKTTQGRYRPPYRMTLLRRAPV